MPHDAAMYPINLQVNMPNRSTQRVWVVQRRAVAASEWNFDPDPDTASFLNGMSVRPVIGIPWSEENATWFNDIGSGATFTLQMNTGAILRYQFEQKSEVRRSDTDIFRQVSPGLVLLLLGATNDDGLPTASRTMILAAYPPEQELSRQGELVGAFALPTPELSPTLVPTATATPLPFMGLDVQIIGVTYQLDNLTTTTSALQRQQLADDVHSRRCLAGAGLRCKSSRPARPCHRLDAIRSGTGASSGFDADMAATR